MGTAMATTKDPDAPICTSIRTSIRTCINAWLEEEVFPIITDRFHLKRKSLLEKACLVMIKHGVTQPSDLVRYSPKRIHEMCNDMVHGLSTDPRMLAFLRAIFKFEVIQMKESLFILLVLQYGEEESQRLLATRQWLQRSSNQRVAIDIWLRRDPLYVLAYQDKDTIDQIMDTLDLISQYRRRFEFELQRLKVYLLSKGYSNLAL
jgi:hypothetical protein